MTMSWMSVRYRMRNWLLKRMREREGRMARLAGTLLECARAGLARVQRLRRSS